MVKARNWAAPATTCGRPISSTPVLTIARPDATQDRPLDWGLPLAQAQEKARQLHQPLLFHLDFNGNSTAQDLHAVLQNRTFKSYARGRFVLAREVFSNMFPPKEYETAEMRGQVERYKAATKRNDVPRIPLAEFETRLRYGIRENQQLPALVVFNAEGQIVTVIANFGVDATHPAITDVLTGGGPALREILEKAMATGH